MSKLLIILTAFILAIPAMAQNGESSQDENSSKFVGRISKLNSGARLARIKTDFANIKFLNRRDRIDFWNESYPEQRCTAFIEGRTNDYILIKIAQFESCVRRMHFTTGTLLNFESQDLRKTLGVAKELVAVLLKKRLALIAKKQRYQREIDGHVEKVEAVNKRYEVLRQKLEIEWQKELSLLEEDKAQVFTGFKNSEASLNEIDTKLEAYRIEDQNLNFDRWSLDPALYIKK